MEKSLTEVRKHETKQPQGSLSMQNCKESEESKITGTGEVSMKRISPASLESGTIGRPIEKSSNTYQISESADSLLDNPLVTLIKQF